MVVAGLPSDIRSRVVQDLTLPNPEFVMRKKLNLWTGNTPETVSLAEWNGDFLTLPLGYLDTLGERIREAGADAPPCHVSDQRLRFPAIDVRMNGKLRGYQKAAMSEMCRYKSGILVAPCGSGKTVAGVALIAYHCQPSIILVHTRQLMEQTAEAVKRWLGVEAGRIGDNVMKPSDITVGMLQTLGARPDLADSLSRKFGLILQDEVHHAPCDTAVKVIQRFPAAYRYGLTATPTRRDGLSPFMTALIGPIRHEITNEDLRNAGVLVVPRVEWVRTDFRSVTNDWTSLISELISDAYRNRLILGVVLKLLDDGRRIIALSERVAHAEYLAKAINLGQPGVAEVVTGQMGKSAREEAMRRIEGGKARILFSTKLADEGLDIPFLDAIVLLTPSRNGGRTMQRVGRVLRSVAGKRAPVIVDIVDASVGLLASQARTRFFEAYRSAAPGCGLPEWLANKRKHIKEEG
jgi:superfamily II DNA or RNA helicase